LAVMEANGNLNGQRESEAFSFGPVPSDLLPEYW